MHRYFQALARFPAAMSDGDVSGKKAGGKAGEGQGDDGRQAHEKSRGTPVSAVMETREDGQLTEISLFAAPDRFVRSVVPLTH